MEHLFIEQTKSTPQINFDFSSNLLRIYGQSYPENAFQFYEPIFKWIDEYIELIQDKRLTKIEFRLPYINTSSSKCIMMMLEKFNDAYSNGINVILNWYYEEENESELECAEEFKEDVEFEFNIIPLCEDN